MDAPVNSEITYREEIPQPNINALIAGWFRFFLRRWWIITLAGILGGCLGIYIAYKDIAQYESRLTFALDDGGADAGGVSSIAAQFGLNIGGSGKSFFSGDNILEIMKSIRIVKSVLLSTDTINGKNKRLIQHFIDFKPKDNTGKMANVSFPVEVDKTAYTYLQDSILYNISKQFSEKYIQAKKPDKKLDIYEVNVTSPNEHFSKVFTDRIVEKTIDFYTELKSKKSKATLDILEQRVASMKGNLNSSISTRYTMPDQNMNPAFAAAQAPLQQQNANIRVYGEAYGEMFKNLELARFQYLKEIPLLQIIDAADYPMKKIKKGRLKTGLIFAVIAGFLAVFILIVYRIARSLFEQPAK